MPHQVLPRLTKRERETLALVIQGMSMNRVSTALNQSPKVVERYIHQGLRKLESWSLEVAPGPSHNSSQDRDLGFLRPREAAGTITRIVQAVGSSWACLVLLAIPDKPESQNAPAVADAISRHIHRNVRGADVITKWSPTEWVMFLPRITGAHLDKVVQRLQHGHNSPSVVYTAARQPQSGESFDDVAQQCHRQLLAQYVTEDLTAYVNSFEDWS